MNAGASFFGLAEDFVTGEVKAAGVVDPALNPPLSTWSLLPEPMCIPEERVHEAALDTLTTKSYAAFAQLSHFVVRHNAEASCSLVHGCGIVRLLTPCLPDARCG